MSTSHLGTKSGGYIQESTGTANAGPEWQAGSLGWRSGEFAVACPLEGLVGLPSSLKEAALLVHPWFSQYHKGFLKATQVPAFHQNEQRLQ